MVDALDAFVDAALCCGALVLSGIFLITLVSWFYGTKE